MNIVPYNHQQQQQPHHPYPSYPPSYNAPSAAYHPNSNVYGATAGYNTQLTTYPTTNLPYAPPIAQSIGYTYPVPAQPVSFYPHPHHQTTYAGGSEVAFIRRRRSMSDFDGRYDSRYRRERERDWMERERLRGEMEGYRRGMEDARERRGGYGGGGGGEYYRDRRPVDREIACAVM
ncbi:MAG: hypothetical protein M1836_000128 [Candelina mexicana]|nr:MAG: hypothetical protein M1836_000128 [Candelina mexicana]